MFSETGTTGLGTVNVVTTDYRGMSPEELAERALARIIHVGEQSHPVIAAQANAYKEYIRQVLVHYLRLAQENERSNIYGALMKHGQADTAELIRRKAVSAILPCSSQR